jgi:hypothetical protein
MSRPIQLPPAIVPFYRKDGSMHPAWRRWFEAVSEALGGYEGLPVLTAGTFAPPTSITVDDNGRISDVS